MTRTFQKSPLALAILALLLEERMHPYRMQQLIKERGKDFVINVERRGSLYQTINQLLKAGLIEVADVARTEGFPERTIYQATPEGKAAAQTWMREMLSTPTNEYPEFPAALSLIPLLPPEDALRQLETRAERLGAQIAEIDRMVREEAQGLPRLLLLEEEYVRLMLATELTWVSGVIADLRSGEITWTEEWLRGLLPPE